MIAADHGQGGKTSCPVRSQPYNIAQVGYSPWFHPTLAPGSESGAADAARLPPRIGILPPCLSSLGAQADGFPAGGGALMKLSFASSYALQAVVHMASLKKNDPVASHNIAQ